ncbi:hypothetical protein [Nocardioides abyssi]|uniref:Hedgehog/Intein (Hint) domain-containing protein n=1 Tax=Nocardioides abyssi TaxID=3058370 RepID=A0ABT8EX95_9ACTN|nr:hypothetical protein [Nocardioides abyssi]MDN4162817.1 hypothetical protein [Nocardioides abyssi]
MTRTRAAYAAPLLALALLATGCAEDEPDAAPAEPSSSSSSSSSSPASSSSASPTAPGSPASGSASGGPGELVAERNGTSAPCIEQVRPGDRIALHDPVLVARGPVTITGVEPVPSDGRLRLLPDPQVVTVTADPAFGPGIQVGEDWPITATAELRRATDWAGRGDLVGREVADGERILPLLGVRLSRDVRGPVLLEGFEVRYESEDGTGSSVLAEVGSNLSPGRC